MKKYTARISNISASQLQDLRERKLRQAKSDTERKFINSSKFGTEIRKQIKENRVNLNISNLRDIAKGLGNTRERQQIIAKVLSEKTKVVDDKVIKTNKFTTLKQTNRLKRIKKQIENNTFNIRKTLAKNKKYIEVKANIPTNASVGEIITALDRTNFYFENRKLINNHNRNVSKYGVDQASTMGWGRKLSKAYAINQNANSDEIDLLNSLDL